MSQQRQEKFCSEGSLAYRGIRSVVARVLRVPMHAAEIPVGAGELLEAFHPAPGWLRLEQLARVCLYVVVILLTMALALVLAVSQEETYFLLILLIPVCIFIPLLVLSLLCLRLRYDCTWYVLTERALRIRRGLIVIHETTITYENVQNVSVKQGPVQRFFGISNISVETAGGGSAEGHGSSENHGGLIEGIGQAEALRERIMKQVRFSRSAGLGDEHPEDRSLEAPQAGSQAQDWVEIAGLLRAIRDDLRPMGG